MPLLLILLLAGIAVVVFEGSALAASSGDTSGNYSSSIVAFAQAIAKAEGFGVPGAIPTLANNPGDLIIPGWTGQKLGSGISVFSGVNEGKDRLYRQLQLIVNGRSGEYTLNDTIQSMAAKYTKTDPTTWAVIVAWNLGVTADTPLSDLLGG
jgi:hypothetical protein